MSDPIEMIGKGRREDPDDRDMGFLMRAMQPSEAVAPLVELQTYRRGKVLNQGPTGTCFPAGTLIRMATGEHKPIEDIRLLDDVVTAEGRTGQVVQTMVRFHGPGLVKLNLWGHRHLRMTAEHPVLTQRGYVQASHLTPGDYVAGTRYTTTNVVEEIQTERWVSAREVARTRAIVNGKIAAYGPSGIAVVTDVTPLPPTIKLTEKIGRLFGLFLAEGSASEQKTIWTFSVTERDTLVTETVSILKDELGINARVQERPNNALNVVVGGKLWSLLFSRMFGTGAASKGLPPELASGPDAFVRAMFEAWLDGDGHTRRGSTQGVTISHRLVMDMHAIAQSAGYRPAVRVTQPKTSHGVKVRRPRWDLVMADGDQDNYRSKQSDSATWRRVVGLDFEDFAGPVYNLHVNGDNSYVAEGIGVHNCVAHAWRSWLDGEPLMTKRGPAPFDLYDQCIVIDPWSDNDRDTERVFGTSVRAGAKILSERGHIERYLWAFSVDDVRRWILSGQGGVVFGVNWYRGLSEPNAEGIIRATGRNEGGHAIYCFGADDRNGFVFLQNSWGDTWGGWLHSMFRNMRIYKGCAKLPYEDLEMLLRQRGEACTAIQK